MPKTNAEGRPSYYDAIGTGETATSATGEVHYLDPTVDPQTGDERDGVIIDGKDAEERERDETERREREEQSEANRTDEQQAQLVRDGKSRSNVGNAEGSDHTRDAKSNETDPAKRSNDVKGGEQTSAGGNLSKASSTQAGKNTPSK